MSAQILLTKLFVPAVRPEFVTRPHLIEQRFQTKISKIVICLLVLLLSVTACRGAESMTGMHPNDNQANNPSTDQIELETFPNKDIIYGTHLRFDHLSIENGLSQNSVLCVLQDSRGFMWFGTEDGLNKFDGYEFTIYKNIPDDSHSISGTWILSMIEDSQGRLWVGTKEEGLNLYSRDDDQFSHFRNDPEDPSSLSDNEIKVIYEDSTGSIWVGTGDGGLNKYDEAGSGFIRYQHKPADSNSLSSNAVNAILEDASGILWVATEDNGLNKFDPETDRWQRYTNNPDDPKSLSNNRINRIFDDSAGVLWIGTDGGGLDKFDAINDHFIHHQHDPENPNTISGDIVSAIFQDRSGVLWIGTIGSGLNQFDTANNIFYRYQHSSGDGNSLSNNYIVSIFEDREGVLWFGSFAAGVNKLVTGWHNFPHYQHDPDNTNSLSDNMIWALLTDTSNALWVGLMENGLDRFDQKSNSWQNFSNNPDDSNSLSNNRVTEIYQDSSDVLWFGTPNGLDRFDPEAEEFTHYQAEPDADPGTLVNAVQVILEDPDGLFWIGTKGGLFQFDPNSNRWDPHYYPNLEDPQSLSGEWIFSMLEDQNGNIWIGTMSGGLNKFDPETKIFTHYQHDDNTPNSLINDFVLSIYRDSMERLWVGTQAGLDLFDPETETFIHYREEDGLPNNTIYCIQEDKLGNLWMSTNNGLSKFDPQSGIFDNYYAADGLQSNEFNVSACYKNEVGEFYFAGINGLNVFLPGNIQRNELIPPIEITSMTINYEEIILIKEDNGSYGITLDWPENSFEFEYAALSFAQPEKNQYAYYLEGFEETWNNVGSRRYGQYTNLPGGVYTLRVKGSNNDGVWNETGTALTITVVPPFWATWWFRGVMLLTLLGVVYGSYRLRVRNLEERERKLKFQVKQSAAELIETQEILQQNEMEKAITEERNRLARDLHDSVTQSVYSLTLLAEAGHRMIRGGDLQQAEGNQTRLGEIAQQALQEMRLLVYELRPQVLQREGFIGALEHRLAAVERRAGINTRLHVAQGIDFPPNFDEELFHLSMEALNNILKHASASEVIVSLYSEKETLILKVEDNGRGFDPGLANNQGGIGISSMIERAEKIGGSLSIQSEIDRGTVLSVRAPLDGYQTSITDDLQEKI